MTKKKNQYKLKCGLIIDDKRHLNMKPMVFSECYYFYLNFDYLDGFFISTTSTWIKSDKLEQYSKEFQLMHDAMVEANQWYSLNK